MKVTIGIPCLLPGGTEFQTLQLVRVLRAAGHEVSVCCYFEHDPAMVAAFERVELLGLERSISPVRLVGVLRRALAKSDVIHVQYMAPGFLAVLAAKLSGARRVFATVHQPATPYGRKARLLLRLAARMCDRFICVSEAVAKSWGVAAVVIHNAVDIARIDAIAPEQVAAIGAVARLRHEKGIDVLLDAMPGERLLIVGDGPDRAVLEKRGGANVVWAGQQPWERAMALMKGMEIVVAPSRFEGFGLTAAEAMAAGKAVVASDVDGLREVVGDAGVLVPAGDAAALAAAVKRLLANPAERNAFGGKARERAERLFAPELFRRKILELYR
jgi:glycosyltransferase involved in cell wall biosynthesis